MPVLAGNITDNLAEEIMQLAPGETIRTLVMMAEQYPTYEQDLAMHSARVPLAERHEQILTGLKALAEATQQDVRQQLATQARNGAVVDWHPFFIANMIAVEAVPEVIRELEQRDDIGDIYFDYPVENIQPIIQESDDRPSGNGLTVINADRVWYELGIIGEGALVCNLDTGVDGSHTALTDRWRGNHASAAECFYDPVLNQTYPYDSGSHGTHTMGTITGMSPVTGDTVGVAFGAEWIAAATCDHPQGDDTVALLFQSFEWAVDPDGDPGTMEDVPDVISNSWGIPHSWLPQCDETYWVVIDNCEAAGSLVVFAAGNEASVGLRSPASRATTEYSTFSVGALDISNPDNPYVASFSSRGPSLCTTDPILMIKPEVSAPGVNIYSSVPGGGYAGGWSGTSMACPHVAGLAGLMRSANPGLDVTTMKQIIMDTAIDIDATGNDNNTGWGMIDCYEAVLAVLNGAVYHDHEITSDDNDNGIPDIGETVTLNVRLRNIGNDNITDATGTLSCASPWITFNNASSTYDPFGPGEIQVNSTPYSVQVDATAPPIFETALTVTVAVSGSERDFTFDFPVGAREQYFLFDCEAGVGDWVHDAPVGWGDQWHLSTEDAWSPLQSWKCGDSGTGNYADNLDARLTTEALLIEPLSQLVIQHRIDAETSGAYPDSAYDGGIVEISTDGLNWAQLNDGGYSKAFRWESGGGSPATHPFPGGTRCYSGSFDWLESVFDLAGWAGETAQFRFRFGSDSGTGAEGWYLDDVALWGYVEASPGDPLVISISYSDPNIVIDWEVEPAAVGYRVYRSLSPYGVFELIQDSAVNSYTASALGEYFYQVTWY
ncbi:S8 family serine peptidase [bacterium]|nr:S8 family serine peptidase [bacterium]